jgi:hypothetical protein
MGSGRFLPLYQLVWYPLVFTGESGVRRRLPVRGFVYRATCEYAERRPKPKHGVASSAALGGDYTRGEAGYIFAD